MSTQKILGSDGQPIQSKAEKYIEKKHLAKGDRLITVYLKDVDPNGRKYLRAKYNDSLSPLDVMQILQVIADQVRPQVKDQAIQVVPAEVITKLGNSGIT